MDAILDTLFIGDYEDATDHNAIRANRIDVVINLSLRKTPSIDDVKAIHIPLRDSRMNSFPDFKQAVETVESFINSGKCILVHCNEGVSRSVAVTAAAIADSDGKDLRTVLNGIERKRPIANPHPFLVEQAQKFLDQR